MKVFVIICEDEDYNAVDAATQNIRHLARGEVQICEAKPKTRRSPKPKRDEAQKES